MWPNLQFPADLVTFTEQILNRKLHFLCSVCKLSQFSIFLNHICIMRICIRGVLRAKSNIWDGTVNYFCKNLPLRCSAGFRYVSVYQYSSHRMNSFTNAEMNLATKSIHYFLCYVEITWLFWIIFHRKSRHD